MRPHSRGSESTDTCNPVKGALSEGCVMGRIHNLEIAVLAQTPAAFIISCAILEKLLNFSVSVMSSLNWGNSPHEKSESEVAVLWLTLCNLMDCNLPDSSIHAIFQARILEWVAISFSKGSSQPKD